jgi:copper resistance protein B
MKLARTVPCFARFLLAAAAPAAAAAMHGMEGAGLQTGLLVERLEAVLGDGADATTIDLRGWLGGDLDRLGFAAEGESAGALRSEVYWQHALAPFWDTTLGLRHDSGTGPARDWLAVGLVGLAPYRLEIEAAAYLGSNGRTALRAHVRHDLRLTRRWVLTPEFESDLYGRADPARRLGAGLSELSFGLRLRLEIRPDLAPYLGMAWRRRLGGTADFARADGESPFERQVVAGLRFWF